MISVSRLLSGLTCLRLFRIVFGPGYEFGLGDHVLHGGGRDAGWLLFTKLNVTVIGVITKLPPAVVTGLIIVLWVALSRFLLLRCWLLSCCSFIDATFILPDLVDGIEDLFGFTLDFLTNLEYKERSDRLFSQVFCIPPCEATTLEQQILQCLGGKQRKEV